MTYRKALKLIVAKLSGIDETDLTTAEKDILRISKLALKRRGK